MRRNVPLVDQVILEILSAIDGGQFAHLEGQLPSEEALASLFQVSRATLREALSKLEIAGVVIRRQGVGTFINQFISKQPALLQDWFEEAHGFVDAIRNSGHEAGSRMILVDVRPAGNLAPHVEAQPDESVVFIEKVIRSSGVPLIHSINVVPLRLLPAGSQPDAAQLAASCDSTFTFLEQYCGMRVHHQHSEIRADLAGEVAEWLECRPDDACLRVEEVAYRSDLAPLFYGVNRFRGDKVSFRQVRRPSLSLTGVQGDSTFGALDNPRR